MNKDVESFKVTYSTMDADHLKEFHQQFKAAAAGIEIPAAGSIDLSKIKEFPKGGKSGGSGGGLSIT